MKFLKNKNKFLLNQVQANKVLQSLVDFYKAKNSFFCEKENSKEELKIVASYSDSLNEFKVSDLNKLNKEKYLVKEIVNDYLFLIVEDPKDNIENNKILNLITEYLLLVSERDNLSKENDILLHSLENTNLNEELGVFVFDMNIKNISFDHKLIDRFSLKKDSFNIDEVKDIFSFDGDKIFPKVSEGINYLIKNGLPEHRVYYNYEFEGINHNEICSLHPLNDEDGNLSKIFGLIIDSNNSVANRSQLLLNSLYDLLKDANLYRGKDEILYDYIIRAVVKSFDQSIAGSIMLKDENESFNYIAAVNYDLDKLKKVSFKLEDLFFYRLGDGISNKAISASIMNFDNEKAIDELSDISEMNTKLGIKSSMSIPIFVDGEIFGEISVDSDLENAYDEFELISFEIFAKEIGNFIKVNNMIIKNSFDSNHDNLTKLYNRNFFMDELNRLYCRRNLPLSVVLVDVNNLKIINDYFGHLSGDQLLIKTSEVLSSTLRDDDIISRLGGDEFAIVLPSTSNEDALRLMSRVNKALDNQKVSNINITISYGVYTEEVEGRTVKSLIRQADKNMYEFKNKNKEKISSKIVDEIMSNLFIQMPNELYHAMLTSRYCWEIAGAMNLSKRDREVLSKAGYYHDIGKIAIIDTLIKNDEELSETDWMEIRKHPEASATILNRSIRHIEYANIVLNHHERNDGSGYPAHLINDAIPKMSQILAVSDVIASMSFDDSYKKLKDLNEIIEVLDSDKFNKEVREVAIDYLNKNGLISIDKL